MLDRSWEDPLVTPQAERGGTDSAGGVDGIIVGDTIRGDTDVGETHVSICTGIYTTYPYISIHI